MESNAEQLIHRWLEKVSEGPPPEPHCDRLDTTDLDLHGGLPIALEPTDTGAVIRWPRINKRHREGDPDSGQQILQQSTGNQYSKRPRRKTREDKYEYKRPGSPKKRVARSHKDKVKRTRTSRKHTISDAFHASNVARERLTLHNTMNMGIFSKGKASSPIKICDVPKISFSETQFLTRQDRGPLETGTGTGMAFDKSPLQKKLSGQHPRPKTSHYFFREPPKLASNEPPLVYHEESPLHTTLGDQLYPSKSQGIVPSPSTAAPAAQDRLHDLQSQLPPHSVERSHSPTPYSWSISDRRGSQQSREVEDRLLKILHTGLSPRQLANSRDSGGSRSGYCTIQDLRSLLESQKAYWQTQTSPEIQSLDGVTTHLANRESSVMVTGTVQSPIKPALSQFKDSETGPRSNNRATNHEKPLDELFRSPQPNQLHSHEGNVSEKDFLASQPPLPARVGAESVEPGAEDDFIFFQELDAAYCAILEPKGANDGPLGQTSMVENEPHRPQVQHTQREDHLSHQKRHLSLSVLFFHQKIWERVLETTPQYRDPRNSSRLSWHLFL
ncbi:uncharacterized protein N7496_004778 [Penicillium cataractarum]|uniref:Uncharacterized protein n=1 Tax=Penicillium cataractarum TaxID=2100454 RepID=A0A9W9SGU0_9EURO|nr:uncharacterized protein N7496_004778 [Penicillium cataractarum]KAJ5377369.1 hypothetical protein N7496_004778 [Penicillium cataractarum]